eukprot:GDKH01002857.1.p3 GENE.GDKH01002857.1~~GDKH01002857.1.p3  ORF type:complete len:122 (+),score=9.66 GDKH01002857.1:94-459(+)
MSTGRKKWHLLREQTADGLPHQPLADSSTLAGVHVAIAAMATPPMATVPHCTTHIGRMRGVDGDSVRNSRVDVQPGCSAAAHTALTALVHSPVLAKMCRPCRVHDTAGYRTLIEDRSVPSK